jgi:hypothetical protein
MRVTNITPGLAGAPVCTCTLIILYRYTVNAATCLSQLASIKKKVSVLRTGTLAVPY